MASIGSRGMGRRPGRLGRKTSNEISTSARVVRCHHAKSKTRFERALQSCPRPHIIVGVQMRVVSSRTRPLNRKTATYRKTLRLVADRMVYRYDEDRERSIQDIARRYFARADEAFVNEAVAMAADMAERNVQRYREQLDDAERYLAEAIGYQLRPNGNRSTLRVVR